jgi:hypothetical protein
MDYTMKMLLCPLVLVVNIHDAVMFSITLNKTSTKVFSAWKIST